MKAVLTRFYRPTQTAGRLTVWEEVNQIPVPRLSICTLELPWKKNKRRISCIPEGKYKVVYRNTPHSSFKYPHFHILDVKDRSWILIHRGNLTEHTAGCILTGNRFQYLNNDNILDVVGSTRALDNMLEILPKEFELTITS